MVGREVGQLYPERPRSKLVDPALRIVGLTVRPADVPISFTLNRGEIVGLAGLEGQGQREIVRCIAGLEPFVGGSVEKIAVDRGSRRVGLSVVETVKAGIGFVPEDRKSEGLYLPLSIEQNVGLGMLRRTPMAAAAKIDRNRVRALMRKMDVRARDEKQAVSSLSGGNQQKVMIGRWLAAGVDVLIVEEPTRGVDVGAKAEIYRLLREFADQGRAVLITSSELTEHLGLCDRILVVRSGAIVSEMAGENATEENVMRYALMGSESEGAAA